MGRRDGSGAVDGTAGAVQVGPRGGPGAEDGKRGGPGGADGTTQVERAGRCLVQVGQWDVWSRRDGRLFDPKETVGYLV